MQSMMDMPDAGRAHADYGPALLPLWPLDPEATFLNHGSYGATPHAVLAAQRAWRAQMERQPVRFMQSVLPDALRAAAGQLAEFLNARPQDVVFVENATAGVNAVLRSLAPDPGDEILTTTQVYPAVRNALRHLCQRAGAVLVEAAVPFPLDGPDQVTAAIVGRLGPRTRLVVVDAVTSPTAVIMPIAQIAASCREAGCRLLVDAAHAPGMLPLDVAGLGADWVTGNAHKWLFAPKGCAFLWARDTAQQGLHPTVISHGLGRGFAAEFDWVGTRDPSAWLSVEAALDFWRALGGPALMARNRALAEQAARLVAERWRSEVGAPAAMRGAMATVALPDRLQPAPHEADLQTALAANERLWREQRLEVPVMAFAGRLWVRVSAQAYNGLDDYERLAQAVVRW